MLVVDEDRPAINGSGVIWSAARGNTEVRREVKAIPMTFATWQAEAPYGSRTGDQPNPSKTGKNVRSQGARAQPKQPKRHCWQFGRANEEKGKTYQTVNGRHLVRAPRPGFDNVR